MKMCHQDCRHKNGKENMFAPRNYYVNHNVYSNNYKRIIDTFNIDKRQKIVLTPQRKCHLGEISHHWLH